MKKRYIFFRVDSGNVLGFGHLNRCLILADEFRRKGFEIHFICKNLKGNFIKDVINYGFEVHKIQNSKNTIEYDFQKTKNILEKFQEKISCLIIDNYRWQRI